jgi:hypothetical protein
VAPWGSFRIGESPVFVAFAFLEAHRLTFTRIFDAGPWRSTGR